MDATNLIAYLPFDTSVTADKFGNTWTTTGTPTIVDNALKLDGSSYLKMTGLFEFTGEPLTISCKFSATSNPSGGYAGLWQMYYGDSNRFQLCISPNGYLELWKDSSRTVDIETNTSVLDGQIHHTECDFDGTNWYLFLDGVLIGTKAHVPSAQDYSLYIGTNYQTGKRLTGTIDEFMIYDGVALHTANFTPPTVADYAELKFALGEETLQVACSFDIEVQVTNSPNINEETPPQISFSGASNNYATLSTDVLPAATEFTIEAKFSTTSTNSTDDYYRQSTIIGRDRPGYHNNSWGLCVNAGKLTFWDERENEAPFNLISDAVVNDGQIHTAAVRSNADGSIDLFCDGAVVAHMDNANVTLPTTDIGVANNLNAGAGALQMNLYEARLWNTARTEIFADIDGTENGLRGWYIPTENGLTDYSPYIRHAVITGTISYSEVNTVFVDVDYESTNDALGWRYEDCAIYFGTGAPIEFHVPPTAEIWVRFDVYFDGVSRWYAYNDGLDGMTGITSRLSLALAFLSADSIVKTSSNICKTKVTQTFLLHMISGVEDGLIEVWCGLEKVGVYNGNVNNGRQFADFKLRSDGMGTSFTELIISNSELQPDEKPANTVRATKTSCLNTCNTKTERIWLEKGGTYPFPYIDVTIRDVMRQIITETIEGEGEFSPITTIWLKFDVYFDGIARWAAYNISETNGKCGVFAELPLDFKYLSNDVEVVREQSALLANHWQTVILHMDSAADSSGVIEAWLDGVKMYEYHGNVNNGDEFTDIYLTSEGSGTMFRNFITSSAPLTEDDNTRTVARGVPKLAFTVRHKGKILAVPLKLPTVLVKPALSIHWSGCDWYNPLVNLTDENASEIVIRYNGAIYALSYS